MEAWIGKNWTSWGGGVVLLLGICFCLKYAWDHGWIRPSPEMRVMLAVALGGIVCAFGEWTWRRKMRPLAASLHGTGIAIIITALFAANRYFRPEVLSHSSAFIGVAIASAVGVILALRVNTVTVAILSFIGAYLCPYILSTHEDQSFELLAYHLMLASSAWTLSFFKGTGASETEKPFGWMSIRWLALIASSLWFFVWWDKIGQRNDYEAYALIWLSLIYCGFFGEIFFTLQTAIPKLSEKIRPATPAPDAALALFSLINTAITFGACFFVLKDGPQSDVALVALALAGFAGIVALLTKSRALMWSALIQFAAMITIAVPLWFEGYSITIAWLVLAIALATIGWRLNIHTARGWAILLLMLATIRLVALDSRSDLIHSTLFTLFSQPFTHWFVLALTTAIVFHAIAWMKPQPGRWTTAAANRLDEIFKAKKWIQDQFVGITRPISTPDVSPDTSTRDALDPIGILVAAFGTILFIGSSLWVWEADWRTLFGIVWLVPIVILSPLGRRVAYLEHSLVLTAIITIHWFIVDNWQPLMHAWKSPAMDLTPPLINLSMLAALLLCIALIHAARQLRAISNESRNNAFVALGCLLFAAITFESWRTVDYLANHGASFTDPTMVKQMAMSVLWSVIGFTMVLIGFWKKIQLLRLAGLVLLAITLTKVFIVDMKEVQAVWRILSFIALGSLLLGVSYLYNKNSLNKSQYGSDQE